jgi:O-antigen/teichoic acid export membrane protein
LFPEERPSFGRVIRTAGILTAGRQLGAVVLTGAVLLLPRYLGGADLDRFLWIYFAQLLLSSILNLGLERYTAREVAGRARERRAAALGTGLVCRAVTAPVTPLALLAVLAFVDVKVSPSTFAAAAVWTLAVQFQGVLFAGVRAVGRGSAEAGLVFAGRVAQAVLLLVGAISGWGVAPLVWVLAAVDVAVMLGSAAVAQAVVGIARPDGIPYRRLGLYTALEISVFAYLRADLLIVGRILGPNAGATYGLAYRVIDALVALSTPALLILFAYASGESARGEDLNLVRRRSQSLLPQLGVLAAALAIVIVGPLARFVPRFHDVAPALRILLATVPLSYLIGVEAHLLSAEDRNAPVLIVALAALAGNVLLNVGLVPSFEFMGAAVALLITELGQVVGLTFGANAPGARYGASHVIPAVALLVAGGALFNLDVAIAGGAALAGAIVIAGVQIRSGLSPDAVEGPR